MKTLDDYMPPLREVCEWFYFPIRSVVAWGVLLALLIGSLAYARQYPQNRTNEAVERIAKLAGQFAASTKKTADNVALVRQALESKGMPAEASIKAVASITEPLAKLAPVTVAMLDEQAAAEEKRYQEAQKVIEASPYKGTPAGELPPTVEGEAYRKALLVNKPLPLRYQRLEAGIARALATVASAVPLQAQAETMWSRIAPRDNAGNPAPGEVSAILQERAKAGQGNHRGLGSLVPGLVGVVSAAGAAAAPPEPAPDASAALAPVTSLSRSAPPPLAFNAEAEKQKKEQAERLRQERAAADRIRQLEQAERQRVQREQQEASEAVRRQEQVARQKELDRQAKQRECTASIFSRIACAAKGNNPITGEESTK